MKRYAADWTPAAQRKMDAERVRLTMEAVRARALPESTTKSLQDLPQGDAQRKYIEGELAKLAERKSIPQESTQGLTEEEFEARKAELKRQKDYLLSQIPPQGKV